MSGKTDTIHLIDALNMLKQNEGYKALMATVQNNIEYLRNQVELGKVEGIDGLVELNYNRGEIAAYRMVQSFVDQMIESLEITKELEEEENGNKEES